MISCNSLEWNEFQVELFLTNGQSPREQGQRLAQCLEKPGQQLLTREDVTSSYRGGKKENFVHNTVVQ